MVCHVCNGKLVDMEPVYACGSGGHINKCNPHTVCVTRSNNDCSLVCQLGKIIYYVMKYTFKSVRNVEFDKQAKQVLEKSAKSTLRSVFSRLYFFKESCEQICNHEMALEALKIDMVKLNKLKLY